MLFLLLLLTFSFVFSVNASTPQYTIQTVAGSTFMGDGGAAASAILSQPEGLAADAVGNVWFADADDSRVRKITANGIIQTVAGTGFPGFSGDNAPGIAAQIDHPYGLALDSLGNLYIADLGNARIRKLTPEGLISTVAGGGTKEPGAATDGLQALDIKLNAPRNVAVDRNGNLYIADFGANQVYQVAPGGIFTTLAGTGKPAFSGDGGLAKGAQLQAPAGLAVDASGVVYVADSGNGRVRKISKGSINTVFTIPSPTGLALNAAGTLYVSGPGYFGTVARAVGSGLTAHDVASDPAGNLYLSTGAFIRKIATDGTISVKAGNGASRYYGGDGGAATLARMHTPSGIAADDVGNLYIADTGNNRIRKVTPNGGMMTLAGTGEAGNGDGKGLAALAQLNAPRALALDSLRSLFVADTGNNRILKISNSGTLSVVAGGLNAPEALAVDSNDVLYVADTGNNRIVRVAPGGALSTVSEVVHPTGLTIDVQGAIYVSGNVKVSKLSSDGTLTPVLDGLKNPHGLAISPLGDLIVVETGAHRIRVAGITGAVAGTGVAGYSGDGGAATLAQVNTPVGVAVDSTGRLLIADSVNGVIRALTPGSPGVSSSLTQLSLVSAASLASGPIAPEELVSIFGTGFDPVKTQVLFDGKPAVVLFANDTQVNILTPADLKPGTSADVVVVVNGAPAAEVLAPVVAAAPALFAVAASGPAAALNEDGSYNSAFNPAIRGTVVSLFGTGWTGAAASPSVMVGGYPAEILYIGAAPGFPGLKQINVRIPGGFLPPGNQAVVLTVGGIASQDGVTVALR